MRGRRLFSSKKPDPLPPPVEPTMLPPIEDEEPVEELAENPLKPLVTDPTIPEDEPDEPPYMIEARLRMQDRLTAERARQNPPPEFTAVAQSTPKKQRKEKSRGNQKAK